MWLSCLPKVFLANKPLFVKKEEEAMTTQASQNNSSTIRRAAVIGSGVMGAASLHI